MPFDYGLRLNNRQRIANAREKPIEANKNQSVDGAEGLFLRSGSPQNVYLLPQRQNFRLERCPRPKQIYDHPNNEPDKISHPATASPDSRSTASQIEFATGTGLVALPATAGSAVVALCDEATSPPAISLFEPVSAVAGPPEPWRGCRKPASRTNGGGCSWSCRRIASRIPGPRIAWCARGRSPSAASRLRA
jgi:hypothetical protein